MSRKSNGQAADGSNVHSRRDDDSHVVPRGRSRGLGSPAPGRRGRSVAPSARGPEGRPLRTRVKCFEELGFYLRRSQ